jgi:hypothetical protein
MPRTRWEVVVFLVGLVLVGGLIASDLRHSRHHRAQQPAAAPATTTTATTTAATTTETTTQAVTARAKPPAAAAAARPSKRRPAATTPMLVLLARRTGCWVSARAGSATGKSLYEGNLESGHRLRLPLAKRGVWLRLGAAGNLAATLNGKQLAAFPQGTVDILVTARGIAPTA